MSEFAVNGDINPARPIANFATIIMAIGFTAFFLPIF